MVCYRGSVCDGQIQGLSVVPPTRLSLSHSSVHCSHIGRSSLTHLLEQRYHIKLLPRTPPPALRCIEDTALQQACWPATQFGHFRDRRIFMCKDGGADASIGHRNITSWGFALSDSDTNLCLARIGGAKDGGNTTSGFAEAWTLLHAAEPLSRPRAHLMQLPR